MFTKIVYAIVVLMVLMLITILLSPYSIRDSGVLVYDYFSQPDMQVDFSNLEDPNFDPKILKDKIVILDFWASWCTPCLSAFPKLDQLSKKYVSSDVVVLGVNVKDDIDNAKKFLSKANISFPIAYDNSLKLNDSLSVNVYPTTFLLDKHHRVTAKFSGFGTNDGNHKRLISALNQLLEAQI